MGKEGREEGVRRGKCQRTGERQGKTQFFGQCYHCGELRGAPRIWFPRAAVRFGTCLTGASDSWLVGAKKNILIVDGEFMKFSDHGQSMALDQEGSMVGLWFISRCLPVKRRNCTLAMACRSAPPGLAATRRRRVAPRRTTAITRPTMVRREFID